MWNEVGAISVDLDDTLWPCRVVIERAELCLAEWLAVQSPGVARVFSATDLRVRRMALARAWPQRAHDMTWLRQESLRLALLDAGENPELAGAACDVFLDARQAVAPFDEVGPILARWAARWPVVAVTNGNADVWRTPLAPHFRAALRADQFGSAKPDAAIFHAAAAAAGVAPEQVLHIGDDLLMDVFGAEDAGLQAAWLRRPEVFGERRQGGLPGGRTEPPAFVSLQAIDQVLQVLARG